MRDRDPHPLGMSHLSAILLALAALTLSGCPLASRVDAQAEVCGDERWGGFEGNPRCAALAQRVIHGPDRACHVDADCSLVHPSAACREQAVATSHLASYRSEGASCTSPMAGPCSTARAVCVSGCCTLSRNP